MRAGPVSRRICRSGIGFCRSERRLKDSLRDVDKSEQSLHLTLGPLTALLLCQEFLESLMFDHNIAHCFQFLPSRFLFIQQLLPSSNVGCMQLLKHVFPKWLQSLSGDDLLPNSSLDHDFKHLAVYMLLELLHPLLAEMPGLADVYHTSNSINWLLVHE